MKQFLLAAIFSCFSLLAFSQTKESLTVNFDSDKDELSAETRQKLDNFINKISKLSIQSISMGGHCDSRGTSAYNEALSLKRVNAVKNYIEKSNKINVALVAARCFGERNLLNNDATEEEARQNRRVEIVADISEVPVSSPEPIKEIKKEEKTLTAMLEDSTAKKGDIITIPNLEFYNNSDLLLPKSGATLEELLNVMQKNLKLRVSIEGHICCVPWVQAVDLSRQQNFNISVIRAKMVYDFLIQHGIDVSRLSYTGFGNSRPLYPIPEKTEQERSANRRVEIRIIDK